MKGSCERLNGLPRRGSSPIVGSRDGTLGQAVVYQVVGGLGVLVNCKRGSGGQGRGSWRVGGGCQRTFAIVSCHRKYERWK
jgi:hypothetical protein